MGEFTKPLEDLSGSVREYVDLKVDEVKLRTAKGLSISVSKVLGMMMIIGLASVVVLALSFGLILLLGELVNSYALGALIVAGVLAVVLIILVVRRDKMFKNSFVRLFVKLFFGGDDDGE